jgi:hypothetical protein
VFPPSSLSRETVTMILSPVLQPGAASASVTLLSPGFAVAPSFTQVRFIGAP